MAPFPSYLEELSLDRALLNLDSHWETLPCPLLGQQFLGFCIEGVGGHGGWMTLASVSGWKGWGGQDRRLLMLSESFLGQVGPRVGNGAAGPLANLSNP